MNLALIEIKKHELNANVFSYVTSNSLLISSLFYRKKVANTESGTKLFLSCLGGLRLDKITFFSSDKGINRNEILRLAERLKSGTGVSVNSFDMTLKFSAPKVNIGPAVFIASSILQN